MAYPLAYTIQIVYPMDREISKSEQSKGKLKSYLPAMLIVATLALAYYFLKDKVRKTGKSSDFHIVTVERGNIRSTLTAAGLVIAASERVINSPVSTEIKDVKLSSGAAVKKGDLILSLDQEFTALAYESLNDELSLRRNNIDKLKLQFDKDLRDLDYQDQIKALQLSELKAQLGDQERLLKIGGATEEEVEAAKLQLSISEIEKKVLENELQFKRQVNQTDKNNLQLEYDIQLKKLKQLKRKLNETQVRSTGDGVITWINEDIGKTVAEGEPLVRIANLNRFEVEATTADRNSKDLLVGLPVEVRINKVKMMGTISRILPEIVNNTIKFYIALDEDNHESLRPSLRTEVFVIKDEKENVVRAKRGNALTGPSSQYVYKVEGSTAIKTRITKGLVSSDYFEIIDGLSVGDKLIISETEEYEHMDEFEIVSKK